MALYLGRDRMKIISNGVVCRAVSPIVSSSPMNTGLLSSDNYILRDSNGLYLIAKEDE